MLSNNGGSKEAFKEVILPAIGFILIFVLIIWILC
jgi:hypothetical protein